MRKTLSKWKLGLLLMAMPMFSLPLSKPVQAISPAALQSGQVDVGFADQGNMKAVQAVGLIKASPAAVWKVLTSYERYQTFMPRVKQCQVQRRQGHIVDALIKLDAPWPFANTWYVNRYFLNPASYTIRWTMVKGSIKHNEGYWQLKPSGKHTMVYYSVKADTGIRLVPQWVIDNVTKTTVPAIYKALRGQLGV